MTDNEGDPVSGASVTFAVVSGGGNVIGGNATTNSSGIATVGSWVLGPVAGPNSLRATVSGIPSVLFMANGVAGPAAQLVPAQGEGQVVPVGEAVPIAPSVRVRDQHGNPVAGAEVAFEVTGGGGAVTGEVQTSSESGFATVGEWTVGNAAGENTLRARVTDDAGIDPVTFTATAAVPGEAAELAAGAGAGQILVAGRPAVILPVATVLDAFGDPVAGVEVTFTVTSGGGTLEGLAAATTETMVESDADGRAGLTEWNMGAAPGMNRITATVPDLDPLFFDAVTVAPGGFDINLQILTALTDDQMTAFTDAAGRWESIIHDDLDNINFASAPIQPNDCGITHPGFSGIVDDLLIWVRVQAIDGVGGILGSAVPCALRNSDSTPVLGIMIFDEADLADIEADGLLDEIIVHEMGHVIGLGSLWNFFGFIINPSVGLAPGVADTHFSGRFAREAFNQVGGLDYANAKVPLENAIGGQGTRDLHWRESVFDTELMTGLTDPGQENPLSIVTIAALMDHGFAVDPTSADPYTLPGLAAIAEGTREGILLVDDLLPGPLFRVSANGSLTPIPIAPSPLPWRR